MQSERKAIIRGDIILGELNDLSVDEHISIDILNFIRTVSDTIGTGPAFWHYR